MCFIRSKPRRLWGVYDQPFSRYRPPKLALSKPKKLVFFTRNCPIFTFRVSLTVPTRGLVATCQWHQCKADVMYLRYDVSIIDLLSRVREKFGAKIGTQNGNFHAILASTRARCHFHTLGRSDAALVTKDSASYVLSLARWVLMMWRQPISRYRLPKLSVTRSLPVAE